MLTLSVEPSFAIASSRAESEAPIAASPASARVRYGSAFETTAFAAMREPSSRSTPETAPPDDSIRATRAPVTIVAPSALALSAKRREIVPIPPSTIIHVPSAPGRRHMLWMRKFMPVPGESKPPASPEKASVTAYIAWRRSLFQPNRAR